jgi:hypothetical protein
MRTQSYFTALTNIISEIIIKCIPDYFNQDIISNFSYLIIFSMVSMRAMQKYGERGYRFILLDAGHMG